MRISPSPSAAAMMWATFSSHGSGRPLETPSILWASPLRGGGPTRERCPDAAPIDPAISVETVPLTSIRRDGF